MTRAFLFPGQGAAIERSAAEWSARSVNVRRLMGVAAREARVDRDELFALGGRALARTELLQPALTGLCLGIHLDLVERGVQPDLVAGHSLGEVAACAASGLFSPEDAIALAAERGRLMARQASRHPGGMVVTDVEEAEVRRAVTDADRCGFAAVAAFNSPSQIAVSGNRASLARVRELIGTTSLGISGPWHSPAMAGAVGELRNRVGSLALAPLRCPLISNRTGDIVERVEGIPSLLAEQLTHPVQWVRSMQTLVRIRVTEVLTIGPAKILRGLVRDCVGHALRVRPIESPEALDAWAKVSPA
ncbi:MAG: ACP S-malonyltransferase [Gemmatimonadales bacterium]